MKLLRTLLLVLCVSFTYAQTTSYYLSAEGKSGSALRSELNGIISGNTAIPYTSTSNTDTWDVLKLSDANSSDPSNVNLIYSGTTTNGAQEWNNGTGWTREHIWPQSLGGFTTSTGVGTDIHNLKPAAPSLNSLRSNLEYDYLGTSGSSVSYNGTATGCRYDGSLGVFEPRNDIKGDLARIILYMDLRYEGIGSEPDLSVQENLNSGGTTFAVLSTLLQWHQNDPVDAFETNRNNVIYNYQGNRNPFVDHPELVDHLYGSNTGVSWNPSSTGSSTGTACGDLFFSEYGEGSSNNKYLEIYNPTDSAISLAGYTVYLSGNGGSYTNTFTSTAVIDSNDVYVITNTSASATILAAADTAMPYPSVAHFNGDDAVILVNGSDTIDVIGVPGVDPGSDWPVGSGSTANNTLVRMISIDQGSTDWAVGATEWDVYSSNDWTFLGSHGSACHGAVPPPPTSFTVTFRVNTANITVGPNGMYAGGGVFGGANGLALTDVGGGIWEGSALLNGSNGGNFAFFNSPAHGSDWGTKEDISGLACADPGNYNDRILPTFTQDTTLLFCFATCDTDGTCPAPPATYDVTFKVDMNDYAYSFGTVYVSGDFNGWSGTANPLSDSDNDGVWTGTYPIGADSIEFKYTLDDWDTDEGLTPGTSCTKTTGGYTNRFLAITGTTDLSKVCWESCSACPSAPAPTTPCSNLFFSEYGEGSSSNKYLEIYNSSSAPVSLSGYTIYLSGNGGSYTNTFTSSAVIDSNGVFVIANSSADASVTALADTTLSYPSIVHFNGDDAVILVHGTDTIDVIGVPGVDPGSDWPVGSGSTANNTLVRMVSITGGSTDWAVGATEWDVYASNDWTYIGSHSSSCHGATPPPPTSFTVTFRVNTANVTVGPNGMYAGGGVLGGADALALTDVGGGIWEGSALLNGSNGGNFAFFNSPAHGSDWGTKENLAGLSCADPGNYNDRILTTFTQDTTLLFCFGSCETDGSCPAPPASNNVTFAVDMNQYTGSTANGVFLNGDFNSWCGNCNAMDDSDSDGVWMVTLPLTQDSIEYKFTVDGWNDQENLTVGSSCTKTTGAYTNRFLAISGDTTLATVCWNSCSGCVTAPPPSTACSELFFSEYGEGSSYNKYFEIYNPSNAPISLSGYTVYLSGNGGSFTNTFTSNAVIDSNDVFVIAHASADPSILALADTALSGYSVAAFNGDDALILVNGSDTIDVIGVPGVDPGSSWPVGSGSTANNTLVRMIGIDQGSTDWAVGATEWDVYSSNDWTFMDSHASNCHGATPPPPTSFTVTFSVNTANITVGPNGMYAGGGVLGGANALALTDVGGGVWEGSALLNGSNGGNFAFFNSPAHGSDWGTKENLSGLSCADPGNYNDRILTTFTQDTTLLFCFGSCETDGTCPTPAVPSNVTFSVDMNQYGGSTANGVFLNGDFNSWCGSCNAMDDSDNDGVWTITLPLTADSIEYKFTVDGWNDQESLTPGSSCTKTTGIYTNRFLAISGDTTLATVCWNSCGSCAPTLPTGVTLDANGCVECDSLNVGDFFVLNGDSVEVVDRARLLAIVAAEGDLTKVCVSHVTDMKILFKGAKWFNQDISTWDVSNVTNMVSMFFNADSFNVNISTWNVSSVENMKLMFRGASAFNQGLNRWDVSSVTNMNRMFLLASAFDGAIGNWDVSSATRMTEMFKDASSFDQDLSGWCVTNFQYNPPTNFATNAPLQTVHYPNWGNCPQTYDSVGSLATGAFVNTNGCIDCSALNVGDYFEMNGDTLLVVDRAMLDSLVLLHADLSRVCVSNITDMKDALRGLRWFNTDISAWDVSNVTDMSNMFFKSRIFNQDIGNWDVSSVTKMAAMFQVAQAFNQDIGGWDVSNVERFRSMFRNADAFNQNIGGWDVSSVLNDAQMSSMFRSADNFSQDLSMWCVSNVATKPAGFDANSALVASQLPVWGTCPTAAPSLYTITSAGQTFTPDTLYCNVGDIITFNVGSNHNAVEVSKTTYLSNGNTPLSGGFSVGFGVVDDFTPTSAGTHYYVCTPHAANNMKGVIIVSGSSSRAGNNSPIASNEVNSKVRTNPAEMPQVAAFPNPTTGMVKISPVVEGTYRIYNEVGRTIGEGQIKEAYDFSTQPSGIYMLMLQTENGTQYLKVVKQ